MILLTEMRLKQGLSKASLARKAKIDQGQLSKIESGRMVPYTSELSRLAVALKYPKDKARQLLSESTSSAGGMGCSQNSGQSNLKQSTKNNGVSHE